jgi:hypothetical protein
MAPRILSCLCLAVVTCARPLAAAAPALEAPQNLTLSVDALQSGNLSWDPIDRDDLMGYSIWMRQGQGDFTRLNIPTTVGGELKKLPMTTKSSLTLKGLGRRTLELCVVAEYESGRSPRSGSVYSARARRPAPEAPALAAAARPHAADADADDSGGDASDSGDGGGQGPAAKAAGSLAAEAGAEDEPKGSLPPPPARSVMPPRGSFHSSIAGGVYWESTKAEGYNSLNDLGFSIVGGPYVDPTARLNWTFSAFRRRTEFPLSLEYGLLDRLEIGGDLAYVEEDEDPFDFMIAGTHYSNVGLDNSAEASGFGNPSAKVRIQPSASLPLRLSLRARIPSGLRSRLQAYTDALFGLPSAEGLDDNAQRLEIKAEYGNRGIDSGLSYALGYVPGSSESAEEHFGSTSVSVVGKRGQELSADVAYSLPWSEKDKPGCAVVELGLKSMDPGDLSIDSINEGRFMSPIDKVVLRSSTGINIDQENQLTAALELRQNVLSSFNLHGVLTNAVDTNGRLFFTVKPNGWIAGLNGGIYY